MVPREFMITVKIGDCKDDLPRIVELAGIVYKSEDVSPFQRYLGFYTICPQSYITAYDDTGALVGYIIAIPVDGNYFETTTKESFLEQDFYSTISKQYTTGSNKIYLFSIVVDPDHSKRVQILGSLARAFIQHLKMMALEGKYITEISALALSESGKKICRGIEMKEIAVNSKGTVFVNRNFIDVYLGQDIKNSIMNRLVRPNQ